MHAMAQTNYTALTSCMFHVPTTTNERPTGTGQSGMECMSAEESIAYLRLGWWQDKTGATGASLAVAQEQCFLVHTLYCAVDGCAGIKWACLSVTMVADA